MLFIINANSPAKIASSANFNIVSPEYDLTGISAGKLSASRIKKEKLQHFKSRLPMAFDDYMFIHSIRRLSPKNIYKYIKWKMENH